MDKSLLEHKRKSHIDKGEIYFWTATINNWQRLPPPCFVSVVRMPGCVSPRNRTKQNEAMRGDTHHGAPDFTHHEIM
jgi:hypothetical protein